MTSEPIENPGKKRVRRDRREEILKAASNLFGIHGFRGTSLAAVAGAVGLTEPGLLHYFPSKVILLQNVLAYRDQQDEEKYIALVQPEALSLPAVVEALGDLVVENEKRPALVRLFTVLVGESIRADHPSHDYFVDRYERIRTVLKEVIREVEVIPPSVDLDTLSALVFAVMDGLQIQWLLDPEKVSMTETFKLFTRILGEYLEK